MKKIVMIVAVALGGLTVMNAQTDLKSAKDVQSQDAQKTELQQKYDQQRAAKKATLEANTDAEKVQKMELQRQDSKLMTQKGTKAFETVDVADVPQVVKETISKQYPGATISSAAMTKDGKYKIVLAGTDVDSRAIYLNKDGQSLKTKLKN